MNLAAVAHRLAGLEREVRRAGVDAPRDGWGWLPPRLWRVDLDLFDDDELDELARLLKRLEVDEHDEATRTAIVELIEATQARTEPPPPPLPVGSPTAVLGEQVKGEREARSDPQVLRVVSGVSVRFGFEPRVELPSAGEPLPRSPLSVATSAAASVAVALEAGMAGVLSPVSVEPQEAPNAAAVVASQSPPEPPRRRYADPTDPDDPVLWRRSRRGANEWEWVFE